MKIITALLVAALALGGCQEPEEIHVPDQCLRREIFKECMAALPKGPDTVVTNDWAEVVNECSTHARDTSKRLRAHIKPECRY